MSTDRQELRRKLTYLYDEYRTAIFNRKYYGHRLKIAKRWNLIFEIMIALGASSAIGAWTLWSTPTGTPVWQGIGVVAALMALAKPILRIATAVERYTGLAVGYNGHCFDVKSIIDHVRLTRELDEKTWESFENSRRRLRDLVMQDDTTPSRRLMDHYYAEVNREVPPESLWLSDK